MPSTAPRGASPTCLLTRRTSTPRTASAASAPRAPRPVVSRARSDRSATSTTPHHAGRRHFRRAPGREPDRLPELLRPHGPSEPRRSRACRPVATRGGRRRRAAQAHRRRRMDRRPARAHGVRLRARRRHDQLRARAAVLDLPGWIIPWGTPVTLVTESPEHIVEAQRQLTRIGIDRPAGGAVGRPAADTPRRSRTSAATRPRPSTSSPPATARKRTSTSSTCAETTNEPEERSRLHPHPAPGPRGQARRGPGRSAVGALRGRVPRQHRREPARPGRARRGAGQRRLLPRGRARPGHGLSATTHRPSPRKERRDERAVR